MTVSGMQHPQGFFPCKTLAQAIRIFKRYQAIFGDGDHDHWNVDRLGHHGMQID